MTTVGTWQSKMTTGVLTGLPGSSLLNDAKDITAEFVFSGFGYTLSAPIVDLSSSADFQRMTAQVDLDENVWTICELNGQRSADSEGVRIQGVTIRIEVAADNPRAHFVASSVQSLLWLAGPVRLRIPELRFDGLLNFTAPLEQIADFLQRRQAAYRLMFIEQVCDQSLSLPPFLSEVDLEALSFAYRAISERSVLQPFHQNAFPFRADERTRALLEDDRPFRYHLVLEQLGHELFGHTLQLGPATFTIEKAVFANPDEVRQELVQLDGHDFQSPIKSLSGTATYEFPAASRFAAEWDKLVEDLLALETELDEAFFQRVNQLAAGSIPDLAEDIPPPFDEEVLRFPV